MNQGNEHHGIYKHGRGKRTKEWSMEATEEGGFNRKKLLTKSHVEKVRLKIDQMDLAIRILMFCN